MNVKHNPRISQKKGGQVTLSLLFTNSDLLNTKYVYICIYKM
jgi:hypothetical protein